MAAPQLFGFIGGPTGLWVVDQQTTVVGENLPKVAALDIVASPPALPAPNDGGWILRGTTSNARYVTRFEHNRLTAAQELPGRPEATRGVLIPIRKSSTWWTMTQDERRTIFEERSQHVAASMKYLPAIARRLHHSRDLGEPFDFLTWFEYAPKFERDFNELLAMLRASEEWAFVDREIDIRLTRSVPAEATRPS
ncbi:chlorite dismutase family protein [bacterium]|nr:chlorite dismutase family protein [bacterium]